MMGSGNAEFLTIPDQPQAQVRVVRSQRRTMALQIRNGEVTARVPRWVRSAVVQQFISQKRRWIVKQLQRHASRAQPRSFGFITGERFPFLDGEMVLWRQTGRQKSFDSDGSRFIVQAPTDLNGDQYVRRAITRWYRQQALHWFTNRHEYWQRRTGLQAQDLKVRAYKARWGCCTSRGVITLNFRLLMAPAWVADYVLVHEMCHLRHHHHGAAFWSLVAQHCTEYRQANQWLKENGGLLAGP